MCVWCVVCVVCVWCVLCVMCVCVVCVLESNDSFSRTLQFKVNKLTAVNPINMTTKTRTIQSRLKTLRVTELFFKFLTVGLIISVQQLLLLQYYNVYFKISVAICHQKVLCMFRFYRCSSIHSASESNAVIIDCFTKKKSKNTNQS